MEAAEEGAVVDADRGFGVIPRERCLEVPEIAGQPIGIQSEVVAGAEDRVITQGRAEDVERLAKEVAGVIGAALGPELGDQLVPAEGTGMVDGQEGQQGDALPQGGSPGDRAVRTVE